MSTGGPQNAPSQQRQTKLTPLGWVGVCLIGVSLFAGFLAFLNYQDVKKLPKPMIVKEHAKINGFPAREEQDLKPHPSVEALRVFTVVAVVALVAGVVCTKMGTRET